MVSGYGGPVAALVWGVASFMVGILFIYLAISTSYIQGDFETMMPVGVGFILLGFGMLYYARRKWFPLRG